MRYAISYDISSDRHRRKVVKALEGLGYRVQYSVFECDLNTAQLKKLQQRLTAHVNKKTNDSIRFYRLCAECETKVDTIGTDQSRTLGGVIIV